MKRINSLKSYVKAKVKPPDWFTSRFECTYVVRQGCLLSPLLFFLFLNDIETGEREGFTMIWFRLQRPEMSSR